MLKTKYAKLGFPFNTDGPELTSEKAKVNLIELFVSLLIMFEIISRINSEVIETEIQPGSSTPIERVLKVSGGDQRKFNAGARAKADARRHARTGGGSILVDGFVPQNTYCQYHKYQPSSCKIPAKLSDNQFQPKDDGNDMSDQDGTGKFDPSDYISLISLITTIQIILDKMLIFLIKNG